MTDSARPITRFETLAPLALEATFDGGRLTSDCGLADLAQVDRDRGLCVAIAAEIPDWRRDARHYPLTLLVRQRIFHALQGAPGVRLRRPERRRPLAP